MSINRGILKRLSIVLTVLFVIVFTVGFSLKENSEHYERVSLMHNMCIDSEVKNLKPNLNRCSQEMTESLARWDSGTVWREYFFAALLVTAFIWLVIGLTYGVTRWVLNGRSEDGGSHAA